MAPHLRESYNKYKLYAVICHIGNSAFAGHYIAYISDSKGHWWKFDDSVASPCPYYPFSYATHSRDQTPYMLLYKKIDHISDPVPSPPDHLATGVQQ